MNYQEALAIHQQKMREELDRRVARRRNLQTDDKYPSVVKVQWEKALCQKNMEHWIRNWAWIYEPRPTPKDLCFVPWDYQWEFMNNLEKHIREGRDLRIGKSRDMGLTWMVLMVFTYLWQFHGMTFLVGSRKAEEVDKLGDMDTLLPKVRFILNHQPEWLLPKGFDFEKHANSMNILNPESNGSISGESNNANFATGGRKNAVLFDEFAKWEYTDSAAWTSAGANTPCRIALSTPFFKNNRFFVLLKEPIDNVDLHWTLHPFKNAGLREQDGKKTSDWYEEQKLRYRPDELAQELDISYAGTQQSSVFHEELAQIRIEKRIRPVPYHQDMEVVWAMDMGIGAAWANGFYQILGYSEEVRWFDYYENQNQGFDHYIDWVKDPERLWNKIYLDQPGGGSNYKPGWRNITVIPDPNQATNRELKTGRSIVDYLRTAGFAKIVVKPVGKLEGINEAKRVFKNLWMDDGTNSPRMIAALDMMQSYHYKWNDRMQEFEQEPVHDTSSHCADQFKYFANYLKNPQQMERQFEKLRIKRDKLLNPQPVHHDVGMAGAG